MVHEAHARISLRKQSQGGPPPSTDAIRKWLERNPQKWDGIRRADIMSAFHCGEEVGLRHYDNIPPDENFLPRKSVSRS